MRPKIITGFVFLLGCALLLEISTRPERYDLNLRNYVFLATIIAMVVFVFTIVYYAPKKPTAEQDAAQLTEMGWFQELIWVEGSQYARAFVTGYLMAKYPWDMGRCSKLADDTVKAAIKSAPEL